MVKKKTSRTRFIVCQRLKDRLSNIKTAMGVGAMPTLDITYTDNPHRAIRLADSEKRVVFVSSLSYSPEYHATLERVIKAFREKNTHPRSVFIIYDEDLVAAKNVQIGKTRVSVLASRGPDTDKELARFLHHLA